MTEATDAPDSDGETGRYVPSVEEGLRSLREHAREKALIARAVHGNLTDRASLDRLLQDERFVRFPVRLALDGAALTPGELAVTQQLGDKPSDGYVMHIAPAFRDRMDVLPMIVAYQLVVVNYGDVATHEEAEVFGSTLLGMEQEGYYQMLCGLADGLKA